MLETEGAIGIENRGWVVFFVRVVLTDLDLRGQQITGTENAYVITAGLML